MREYKERHRRRERHRDHTIKQNSLSFFSFTIYAFPSRAWIWVALPASCETVNWAPVACAASVPAVAVRCLAVFVVGVGAIFSRPTLAVVLHREVLVPKGTRDVSASADSHVRVLPINLIPDVDVAVGKSSVRPVVVAAQRFLIRQGLCGKECVHANRLVSSD